MPPATRRNRQAASLAETQAGNARPADSIPNPAASTEGGGPLARLFALCDSEQQREYLPEKRSFRIQGHSTTIRLERAFWTVLEDLAKEENNTVTGVVARLAEHCQQANDRNLASCLRVLCLKYINVFSDGRADPGVSLPPPSWDGRTSVPDVLDLRGMTCPLPVLRTKKAIRNMRPGATFTVLATDSGAVRDLQGFCRSTGNQLVRWHEDGGVYSFTIRKAAN
ncbi:MAG: sulfurtransferase TusA family protein [Rhodospirillales bacterium]|nr:sulfurtransferase TusA family protein [Rhodospirillales bacterium]